MQPGGEPRVQWSAFHAVAPSVYQAIWPAFITVWDAKRLTVRVVPAERASDGTAPPASVDACRDVTVAAKRRLHQAAFRELVLDTYDGRCAVSGLFGAFTMET